MTTSPPTQAPASRDRIDTGPLSWVIGEIREALNRSRDALRDAVAQDVDARPTSLRLAKTYLHQAHGALQIVDVDGIAIITETVEDLLERVDAGQVEISAELADAIGGSYQALVEYLDELLSGMPHQPVRLFPYYRSLLEARGAERVHPADLFFPNLAIRPQLPVAEPDNQARPSKYMAMRQHFEKALLPFLRSSDRSAELANAAAMRDIIGEIERVQSSQQARAFWWVMHGLADEVAAGHIQNEIYVKQLFARINLQIRRLSQGSPSIAERLLRDALFFIARAVEPSSRARQIREVYQLDGLVPTDYDTRRYGQIDTDALAMAKERLAQAKSIWNRVAGGDANFADSFEHEMHMLADAGARLNSAPLSKLLRELKGIARHAAHAKAGDTLSLEVATSLLFVENALNSISRLPENFTERADAMTARLLAVVSGEDPRHTAPWLDDMSREAQQRQTMTALAGEMQSSLRQVEKMLDEYFRDPSQRTALGQLDGVLHQIEGALAVLDQDDAMRTVQHTRAAVRRFIDAEVDAAPMQGDFQQVAQNVGALSFFIESLQLPAGVAAKRFTFDEDTGTFHAHLIEKDAQGEGALDVPVDLGGEQAGGLSAETESTISPVPTVEDELAFHQQQSAELAMSLSVEPDNPVLQEQLKESLEKIRLDATLIDNPELNDRARATIDLLGRADLSESREALAQIITATVPEVQVADPLPPVVAPETDEAIDAELLEIFLSEAEEVLGAVRETLPLSRMQPHNQEHLTTLRRCFHTLKGSSRMVGLNAYGEAAWGIEQVLNLRLSESRSGDAELYALLEKAADVLGDWVQDLKNTGTSSRTPDALVRAAERIKAGGQFSYEEEVAPSPGPQAPEIGQGIAELDLPVQMEQLTGDAEEVPLVADDGNDGLDEVMAALPQVEELSPGDADLAMFNTVAEDPPAQVVVLEPATEAPQEERAVEPVIKIADVIEFPTMQPVEPRRDDNVKRIGDIEISVPLHNIYLAETDELVRLLSQDFSEWRHEPEREVDIHAVHAAHSLAGSSATVGFKALQEVAHALEMFLQSLSRAPIRLEAHEFDVLEQSVERIKLMLQKFALGEMPVFQPEFVRILDALRQGVELRAQEHEHSVEMPEMVAFEDAGDEGGGYESAASAIDSSDEAEAIEDALPDTPAVESVADTTIDATLVLKDELDADLMPVFLEEGRDILPQMAGVLRGWQDDPASASAPQSLLRSLHTLK
ncbi:Hpt domain-containing protein, partial [Noviherbaspirillum denitrificans]|uniref:Hpt domain-containing protein n=1 Tax=Noviherbaspirillum denitrificans TaxID=1968433 RepID=UPI00197F710E